ncbi:Adenosine 5'-monophosphoramidase [Gamsiella multidivaricata]|nr:Adenosine 5'-monophosphoramidase [Gamsiella multidivaricata]
MASNPACIFCRIIKREIPAKILFETEHSLALLDLGPLSEGHTLVIPKHHAQFLHELPDADMVDLLPTAKKVAQAIGCKNYNAVDHVHFHVIPKNSEDDGLVMEWKAKETDADKLEALRKTYLKL